MSQIELKKLEKLAKLEFSQDEIERFNKQFNDILDYMKELDELNLENIGPFYNSPSVCNVFREDETIKIFDVEDILKNAPSRFEQYFQVPKVI